MKTVNVRELRAEIPRLRQTLADEHEILLVNGGEPVARIVPLVRTRPVRSLAAHRARMQPLPKGTLDAALREERDRR